LKDNAKPSRPKRQTKAEQRARMLDQLLDAAEYLFSKHGLYGVTLKDISTRVGVHTSLPHYYFENKKELFDAVVARRAPQSCNTRLEAMDRYEREAGDNITVEGALRAFLDTDLDNYSKGGEGWRNYGALGAQVSNTPEWGAEVMDRFFDPVVLRLIELLKKALPDCPEETIFWGYHFVTGSLMLTIGRTGRIDVLSNGLCKSEDFETIKKHMATFMAAGFKAICHN
jgi:AcrR family transcriptional regulator